MVDVGKLFCQSHHRTFLILRNVCVEGTALMGNVIGSDGNIVLFKCSQKLRIIADDTGGDHLGSLPVAYRKSLQLFI